MNKLLHPGLRKKPFFFLLLFISMTAMSMMSCKQDDGTETKVTVDAAPELIAKKDRMKGYIDSVFLTRSEAEDSLYTTRMLYEDAKAIATGMKQDTSVPEVLFRAGALASGRKDPTKAIGIWGLITSEFPESRWASEAAFQKAFTFDNDLHDKETAKKNYEEFLKDYPNHKLAGDVKLLLQTMNKTDAQLIEEFEKKNNIKSN